jgi:broad specificity phosphatase PhoE
MTTVWLIRHGLTATNGHSYAGRADVPLTAKGIAQARFIARQLADERPDMIFSSPLQRALDTARPLADSVGCPIHTSPDLLEFHFGALEGRAKCEVALSLRKAHLTTPVPGGESLADLWARTGRVAQQVLHMPPHSRVAVVGHYWTNRMIHGHLTGCSMLQTARARSYRPETGGILCLDIREPAS